MPASKRIIITLSPKMLSELDEAAFLEKKNRSQLLREAIHYYLGERKKNLIKEQMKKGYKEMAEINLTLTRNTCNIDEEALLNGLEKLVE